MTFSFPIETVKEGKAKVAVPKLELSLAESSEHVPSKAPVFYNPRMELNRDLAVLVLQTYQKTVNRKVAVCEPLTGCGVRGIRFAKEVEGLEKVVINDISPEAAQLAQYNVQKNRASSKVKVFNQDANFFLSQFAAPRKRFDYIDIDPFGSPVAYLDSAVRSLRNGGLLALTATDMAPLCGVHPNACLRKYGGKPLRTEYCHELALRLLIGCTVMTAAKHDVGLEAVFSYSAHNYVRTYVLLTYGAKEADKSIGEMGFVQHCFACFHRHVTYGISPYLEKVCPECSSKLNLAGPLWLGQLWNKQFLGKLRKEAETRNLRLKQQILRLLFLASGESEAPMTYFVVDKLCDKWSLTIPSFNRVIEELQKKGYEAVPTHFSLKALRTNAPASVMKEILSRLAESRE
jgi:tRNA (guanine26-N2/guanine27-N2)-dimethyltransferase